MNVRDILNRVRKKCFLTLFMAYWFTVYQFFDQLHFRQFCVYCFFSYSENNNLLINRIIALNFFFRKLQKESVCKIRKSRTGRRETKTRGNFLFKNAQSQKLSILLADCRAVVFCKRNHSISKEICKTSNENKISQITEKFQINSKTTVAS